MSTKPAPLVRARDIAKHFSVTDACVSKWAIEGTIPCVRVGKTVRFDFAAVMSAVEAMQKQPKPDR